MLGEPLRSRLERIGENMVGAAMPAAIEGRRRFYFRITAPAISLLERTHPHRMNTIVAITICAIFLALALWPFHMASAPGRYDGGVPSVDGKPVFVPSTRATVLVGIMLVLFAALVAATAGWVTVALPRAILAWLSYGLALGLLVRAIGDFRYVGFFKRVRGSRFATLDTWLYSPLCLWLAAGVAFVATQPAR